MNNNTSWLTEPCTLTLYIVTVSRTKQGEWHETIRFSRNGKHNSQTKLHTFQLYENNNAYTYTIQLSIHSPEGDNNSWRNIALSPSAEQPPRRSPTSRVPLPIFPEQAIDFFFARGETRRLIFAREVGCLAADRSASFVFTLRVKPVAPCIKPDNPRAEDPKPHKHRYAALRRPHPPPSIPKLLTPIYTPVQQPLEINPYRIRAGARTRFQPNWPPLSKLQIVESLSYFCEHGDTILFQIGNFLEIFWSILRYFVDPFYWIVNIAWERV